LNSLPEWALALLFVGGTVIVTLVAFKLVCRFLPEWRSAGSVEGVIGVAAMVMTLYALVLAFVVVNLYSDYTSASTDVTDEANALGALVQDVRAFPAADRLGVDRAVARYVVEVRNHEFPDLAHGGSDPRAERLVSGVFAAVQRYSPVTTTQTAFYSGATDQLNIFVGERENRVAKAGTSIPVPLLALLIFLAITTIAVILLVDTPHRGVDIALIVVVAVVVAAGLLTALILQYPYSGSIAVQSDPFAHGSLTEIRALVR
jgi:hypothetical protein